MIYIGSHKKQYIGENTIADITLPNGLCIRVVQKLTVDDIKKLNQSDSSTARIAIVDNDYMTVTNRSSPAAKKEPPAPSNAPG